MTSRLETGTNREHSATRVREKTQAIRAFTESGLMADLRNLVLNDKHTHEETRRNQRVGKTFIKGAFEITFFHRDKKKPNLIRCKLHAGLPKENPREWNVEMDEDTLKMSGVTTEGKPLRMEIPLRAGEEELQKQNDDDLKGLEYDSTVAYEHLRQAGLILALHYGMDAGNVPGTPADKALERARAKNPEVFGRIGDIRQELAETFRSLDTPESDSERWKNRRKG